jgi:5-methylcytosine-specific restriction endonuclease McrA
MDWERFSNDQVEEILAVAERKFSEGRALQIEALEELDRRQVFTADGCRNLSEWTASRLDVGSDTARTLVQTMRRTTDKPWIRQALSAGAISFDRAAALSRIDENVGTLSHLDVSGVRREAADRVELTVEDEIRSAEDRYLIMQPSLDESWWTLRGGLDGVTGAVIDQALTQKADELPELPDGSRGSGAWRKATALYELASGGSSPQAQLTVFVDAEKATPTSGKAGVRLEAGPRVGARALEAIFCDSVTEVTVNSADGEFISYGRKSRMIPPALRRAVLARTGGHCAVDGCDSTYRVEVHHRIPWSEGGRTDPENLIALCWFHHHIAVHERGFQIYEHPDHGRIRLRRPREDDSETRFHSPLPADQNRRYSPRSAPPPREETGPKPEG